MEELGEAAACGFKPTMVFGGIDGKTHEYRLIEVAPADDAEKKHAIEDRTYYSKRPCRLEKKAGVLALYEKVK